MPQTRRATPPAPALSRGGVRFRGCTCRDNSPAIFRRNVPPLLFVRPALRTRTSAAPRSTASRRYLVAAPRCPVDSPTHAAVPDTRACWTDSAALAAASPAPRAAAHDYRSRASLPKPPDTRADNAAHRDSAARCPPCRSAVPLFLAFADARHVHTAGQYLAQSSGWTKTSAPIRWWSTTIASRDPSAWLAAIHSSETFPPDTDMLARSPAPTVHANPANTGCDRPRWPMRGTPHPPTCTWPCCPSATTDSVRYAQIFPAPLPAPD